MRAKFYKYAHGLMGSYLVECNENDPERLM